MRPIDASLFAVYSFKTPDGYDDDSYTAGVVRVLEDMDEAPTLDYKDLVPQGEWIDCRGGDATCSRCGIRQKAVYDDDNEQHFCGHCGARMVRK